jgi:heme O synthase-like polyprenyltransferase
LGSHILAALAAAQGKQKFPLRVHQTYKTRKTAMQQFCFSYAALTILFSATSTSAIIVLVLVALAGG